MSKFFSIAIIVLVLSNRFLVLANTLEINNVEKQYYEFEQKINKKYQRNLTAYPLAQNEKGEVVNVQNNACNNFNHRPEGLKPLYIIQHHTATENFQKVINAFFKNNTSAHYVIDVDGTI